MPKLKIGRKALSTIKAAAADTRQVYYDDELAGFALRVEPSGRMTYFIEYRPGAGGRGVIKKRVTLGTATEHTGKNRTEESDCSRKRTKKSSFRTGDEGAQEKRTKQSKLGLVDKRDSQISA